MSPITRFIRTFVAVTLVCQQMAFAAIPSLIGAPLVLPETKKQAAEVIVRAETIPVEGYFTKGGTPSEVERFNKDLMVVAQAHQLLGTIDNLSSFKEWYLVNQASVIIGRDQAKAHDLDGFFAGVVIRYVVEDAAKSKDPWAALLWIKAHVGNGTLMTIGTSAFGVAMFVAGTLFSTLKGAITAGPAGRIANAYLDPIVKPLAEGAELKGAKHLGEVGIWLNNYFFQKAGTKKGAAEELKRLLAEIAEAKGEGHEVLKLNKELGYNITAAGHIDNMKLLGNIAFKTLKVWKETNPPSFREGRDIFMNAISKVPQAEATNIMVSHQGGIQAQQSIEAIIDRIVIRKQTDPVKVEAKVVKLLRLVQLKGTAAETNSPESRAEFDEAKVALKELGATDFQVERLIESRISQLVYARNTAHALAANWIRENVFPEFNIDLPGEVDTIQRIMRDGSVLAFFHHEYKAEVSQIIKNLGFMIDMTEAELKAASVAANSPIIENSTMPEKVESPIRRKLRETTTALAVRVSRQTLTCEALFN